MWQEARNRSGTMLFMSSSHPSKAPAILGSEEPFDWSLDWAFAFSFGFSLVFEEGGVE